MGDRLLSGLIFAGNQAQSEKPQALQVLCGVPVGSYIFDILDSVGVKQAVVVSDSVAMVSKGLMQDPPWYQIRFADRRQMEGSGSSVIVGLSDLDDLGEDESLLIIPAESVLVKPNTLGRLVDQHYKNKAACTFLSYRQIVKDLTAEDKVITRSKSGAIIDCTKDRPVVDEGSEVEIASSIFCVRRELVAAALRRANDRTERLEISDLVKVLAESGLICETLEVPSKEVLMVDNHKKLAIAEAELRNRTNEYWLNNGVTMVDPNNTYIDTKVKIASGVTLFPGVHLRGKTTIASGCEIGPDIKLDSCQVGESSKLQYMVGVNNRIGDNCRVGPYVYLEPGAPVEDGDVRHI